MSVKPSTIESDKQDESLESRFASETTCHGFSRCQVASHPFHKLFWALAILTGFGMTCWLISLRIMTYLQYNTTTEVILEYKNNLEFPSVTFCNANRYRRSALTNTDLYVLKGVSNIEDLDDIELEIQVANLTHAEARRLIKSRRLSALRAIEDNITSEYPDGFDYEEFTKRVGWRLNYNTMAMCKFGTIRCSKNDFQMRQTPYGNCFTFNPDPSQRKFLQSQPGSVNGLKVLLDIDVDDYGETLKVADVHIYMGIKMLVHPHYEEPDMYGKGIVIGPGNSAAVPIQSHEIENTTPPWGKCDPSKKLDYSSVYSQTNCALECVSKKVIKTCGCRLPHYPGTAKACGIYNYTACASPEKARINADFVRHCGSECPIPCNIKHYPTSISYAPFPSPPVAEEFAVMYNTSRDFLQKNLVGISIFYDDMNYHTTKINPAMTTSALISDIGGQLGLFIGMSAITLLEFIEYLLLKLRQILSTKPKITYVKDMKGTKSDKLSPISVVM